MNDTILKGKSIDELKEIFKKIGEPAFRAKQAFLRINKHLAVTLDQFTEFSLPLRDKLREMNAFPSLEMIHKAPDVDGTEKVIFRIGQNDEGDEKLVETVWIVTEKRKTLCISSQVGCSLKCAFCATGTMKFRGNLETWMILDQVYDMLRYKKEKATNIVFMGMGEPFYNYDNVIKAAHILNSDDGLNISSRHITISTAGVLPAIRRYTEEKQPFNLALSLNHPYEGGRREIMDIEERHSLADVIAALRQYSRTLGKKVTFEYVCIPGVNMSEKEAKEIIRIGKSINCKVNLIPLNTNYHGWRSPTQTEILSFQKILTDGGIRAFNRGSPGKSVSGACGMLALKH